MQFNPNMIGNNSIKNYNSFLNSEMQALNINFDKQGMVDFDNVLQREMQVRNSLPQGPIINTGIQMNVGLENMGISPIDRLDNVAQVQENSLNSQNQRRSNSAVEKPSAERTFSESGVTTILLSTVVTTCVRSLPSAGLLIPVEFQFTAGSISEAAMETSSIVRLRRWKVSFLSRSPYTAANMAEHRHALIIYSKIVISIKTPVLKG